MLLLDGFDELPFDLRDSVVNEINSLCQYDESVKVVLTSRSADFRRKPEGFIVFEIVPLSAELQRQFVDLWFGAL